MMIAFDERFACRAVALDKKRHFGLGIEPSSSEDACAISESDVLTTILAKELWFGFQVSTYDLFFILVVSTAVKRLTDLHWRSHTSTYSSSPFPVIYCDSDVDHVSSLGPVIGRECYHPPVLQSVHATCEARSC